MADPLWGELAKSQDDPETIEEAIARIVAEHEADPEAHLGEGESLSEHKHEGVIDHPQGSVLADKWTASELDLTTTFENLDAFIVRSPVTQLWPGFYTDPGASGYANRSGVQTGGEELGLSFTPLDMALVQFTFSIDAGSTARMVLRMGAVESMGDDFKVGMGVYIVGDEMRFFAGDEVNGDVVESDPFTLSQLTPYIVRLFNNTITGKVECYINGNLFAELEWDSTSYDFYADTFMHSWYESGSGGVLTVNSLFLSITP